MNNDIYKQSIDDYCPIIAYLENENVKFDQTIGRWIVSPLTEFEFTYKLDLGSAQLNGPSLGRNISLLIDHLEFNTICHKKLDFEWFNGKWILSGWNPEEMNFSELEKCEFIVPEIIQYSLTTIVKKLGTKLCREFDFLNEKPMIQQKNRLDSKDKNELDSDVFQDYVSDRKNAIEDCANELLLAIDCDDQEYRLHQYFIKVLEKFM